LPTRESSLAEASEGKRISADLFLQHSGAPSVEHCSFTFVSDLQQEKREAEIITAKKIFFITKITCFKFTAKIQACGRGRQSPYNGKRSVSIHKK
jgi:hypothetical protein